MAQEQTKKQWLELELAAVITKIAEVETAKTNYLASYEIATERLEQGKEKLLELIADQQE